MICPMCRSKLKINIHSTDRDDGNFNLAYHAEPLDIFENRLRRAYIDYCRWVVQGRREYRGEQYYHDNYHDHIECIDPAASRYEYRIQTFDSPEGDVWESGIFVVKYGLLIEIEKTSSKWR